MLNKKGSVNFVFIIVLLSSIFIWIYFKDFRTGFILFLAYAAIRIIANFLKKDKPVEEYYE